MVVSLRSFVAATVLGVALLSSAGCGTDTGDDPPGPGAPQESSRSPDRANSEPGTPLGDPSGTATADVPVSPPVGPPSAPPVPAE